MLGMTCCIVWKRISMLLLIVPFICPFFFLSNKTFHHRNRSSYYSQSLQILYKPWEGAKYIVGKKTKMLWLISASFLLFSISHSSVIHREIGVKDFSGTTVPRILKFGTNAGFDLLYCVKENQNVATYYSLICPFFFLSKQIFCFIFLSFYESQSLQILYTPWEGPSILEDRKQNWDLFCLLFPFFHLSLQCNT